MVGLCTIDGEVENEEVATSFCFLWQCWLDGYCE